MVLPKKDFFHLFKATPGALSVCEAIAIANIAYEAPQGVYMDLGSHAGKAAMSAAAALQPGNFILVDPCYDLTNREAWAHSVQKVPENMGWHYVNDPDFVKNIAQRMQAVSHPEMRFIFLGDYSEHAIQKHDKYAYVFVDSDDHDIELVMTELKLLEDRMIEGGIIAFHDFGNQYHAPKEGHQYLLSTGKYENITIDWNFITAYVTENKLEEGNDSWHMPGNPLPNFVGAARRLKG